jgi:hypothetical protein
MDIVQRFGGFIPDEHNRITISWRDFDELYDKARHNPYSRDYTEMRAQIKRLTRMLQDATRGAQAKCYTDGKVRKPH